MANMVTIHCCDCYTTREIKPQDAFQVKRCVDCQKKYAAARRRLNAQWKRERQQENIANVDRIAAIWAEQAKITWEDYCFLNWGLGDLTDRDAFRIWGKYECRATADHSYDEDDIAYWRSNGDTDEEIENRLAERGADSLITNEMDNCGDINLGRENPSTMKYLIEEAYRRYK